MGRVTRRSSAAAWRVAATVAVAPAAASAAATRARAPVARAAWAVHLYADVSRLALGRHNRSLSNTEQDKRLLIQGILTSRRPEIKC